MRRTTILALVAAVLTLGACAGPGPEYDGGEPARDVGLQLFQWNWESIGRECTEVLGPAGIAWVLTSPPQEHIQGSAWWTAYQPVSYRIESRLGTRDQFAQMVTDCHDAGVKVIADAVINHMTGQDSGGEGWAGSAYQHYDYPGLYTEDDFHHCGLSASDDITDYTSAGNVQNCELVNLADLATEKDTVRSTIAGYLNDLLTLGVDGFRIDAAKHMPAEDVAAILAKVDGDPYIVQEVIRGEGEPIQPEDYLDNGDVFEFGLAYQLPAWLKTGQLGNLTNIDGYGFVPGDEARTFVDNHDTERNRQTLSYRDGWRYLLAEYLLLASDYGSPVLYSGYSFTLNDQGLPLEADGSVSDVDCAPQADAYADGKWVCQHRAPGVLPMVGWRSAVAGSPVTSEWTGEDAYAFQRGPGFVAFNAGETELAGTFTTTLAPGEYCDAIAGDCGIVVGPGGALELPVPPHAAVALLPAP